MKNILLILLLFTLSFGSLLQGEVLGASLKNVTPHPATNPRLMMGLKGPVKSVSLSGDPTELGDLIYWFDEQGFTTRFYVEPEWGARSLSLELIYKTEADRITEIKMVDEKGKLYGLQTFSYDAQGVLYKSTFDMYDGDLIFYDYLNGVETYDHDRYIDKGYNNIMLWDPQGHLISYTGRGQDPTDSYGSKFFYDDAGHLIRCEHLDAKGNITSYTVYQYNEDGDCGIASMYDANRKKTGTKTYSHDKKGNPVSIHHYTAAGKLEYKEAFQYSYDEYGNCTHSENGWGMSDNVYIYYPR